LSFKGKPINELIPQEQEVFMEYRDRIMERSLGLDQGTIRAAEAAER
jgi:hypothetical protein